MKYCEYVTVVVLEIDFSCRLLPASLIYYGLQLQTVRTVKIVKYQMYPKTLTILRLYALFTNTS